MSIPINTRQEIAISSIGNEQRPQCVIIKNSLWTVVRASKIILNEYGGSVIHELNIDIPAQFVATYAKKTDGSLYSDRFWLWTRKTNNKINLYEIEPFTAYEPVIHRQTTFNAEADYFDVSGSRVVVFSNDKLYATSVVGPLEDDIKSACQKIDWDPANLDMVGVATFSNNKIYSTSLNVSSPPNEQYEEYEYPPPSEITITENTPFSNIINLSWPADPVGTSYVIESDDNPGFSTPVILYEGSGISTTDIVMYMGIHYYRILRKNDAGLESSWLYGQVETFDNKSEIVGTYNLSQESYLDFSSPSGISLSENTPFSNIIQLWWEPLTRAVSYVIEGDSNEEFTSPTVVYDGFNLSTTDTVLFMGFHYYRIAARNVYGYQSIWVYDSIETFGNISTITESLDLPSESYLDFSSPSGINLSENTPFSNIIQLWWDPLVRAVSYVIEADSDPEFSNPTVVYDGDMLLTTDIVLFMGLHYYRIAARNSYGYQSIWIYGEIETFGNDARFGDSQLSSLESYLLTVPPAVIGVLTSFSPVRSMRLKGGNSVYALPIYIDSPTNRRVDSEEIDSGESVLDIKSPIERNVKIKWGKQFY